MNNNSKIMKFGGAALINVNAINKFIEIIRNADETRVICVISAFGKTTANLNKAAELAENGFLDKSFIIINDIVAFHKSLYSGIPDYEMKADLNINDIKNELSSILKGISITRELTPKIRDLVLSYGEILSCDIIKFFLNINNLMNVFIDAGDLIATDENFGDATPDLELSRLLITNQMSNLPNQPFTVIIPGFIARSKDGNRTTMGYESSNLTALIIADVLNINQITLWTDVNGIRTADPNIFSDTKLINSLDYRQAEIASYAGLKLIYPDMIKLARKKNIQLFFKSLQYSNNDYSEIFHTSTTLPLLISDNGYCKINHQSNDCKKINFRNPVFVDRDFIYSKTSSENDDYSITAVLFSTKDLFLSILDFIVSNSELIIKSEFDANGIYILSEKKDSIIISEKIHTIIKAFFSKI